MEKFIRELVECRMQLLRDKSGEHITFNRMCFSDLFTGKPTIYVGWEDGSGYVVEDVLSSFEDEDFADEVYNLLAKIYPSVPQYEIW